MKKRKVLCLSCDEISYLQPDLMGNDCYNDDCDDRWAEFEDQGLVFTEEKDGVEVEVST